MKLKRTPCGRHTAKENATWESCNGAGDANWSSFMHGKPNLVEEKGRNQTAEEGSRQNSNPKSLIQENALEFETLIC
jgi:hypothetical protein